MTSRTTDDYQAMSKSGIAVVVEPAFWMGQSRTHVGSFEDYFLSLIGWERFRAQQFGIHHFCTLALNPKEANQPHLAKGVLEILPRYLEKESVVAVGEIGLDDQTPAEEEVFARQLELAKHHQLPVLIHTPHRDKKQGTKRCLEIAKESGLDPKMILVDHNTEETLPQVLDLGFWAGHSIYPETKMDEKRMVQILKEFGGERIIVNSAADWGVSDPLMVPKTLMLARTHRLEEDLLEQVFWQNPKNFFAQSGRFESLDLSQAPSVDQRQTHGGNSVLRGQEPRVN